MLSFGSTWSFDTVTSTMDVARELAAGVLPGTVSLVFSRRQTEGRGRQGRTWMSADGAFLGTYIMRLPVSAARLQGFSLVVGLILHQFFAERGVHTLVKWPNDVLAPDRRKIAGVLVEVVGSRPEFSGADVTVLCGIGCNLGSVPNETVVAASVREFGLSLSPEEFAMSLTPSFLLHTSRFMHGGFAVFKDEWLACAYRPSGEVSVRAGHEELRGYWEDITDDGSLVIRDEHARRRVVVSGELQLV